MPYRESRLKDIMERHYTAKPGSMIVRLHWGVV